MAWGICEYELSNIKDMVFWMVNFCDDVGLLWNVIFCQKMHYQMYLKLNVNGILDLWIYLFKNKQVFSSIIFGTCVSLYYVEIICAQCYRCYRWLHDYVFE